jgi:hypothetical protein
MADAGLIGRPLMGGERLVRQAVPAPSADLRRLAEDPVSLVERIAGLLDLDVERLSRWLFARCVVESADPPGLLVVAGRLAPP